MELKGEISLAAGRDAVWRALNDVEVLRRSIEGCERLERFGEDVLEGTIVATVGPVRARFTGIVTLSEVDPPNGYVFAIEGKGGPAGFAKGVATIRLSPDGSGTALQYAFRATVGGKLAQIGARLVDSVAARQAEMFFAALTRELDTEEAIKNVRHGSEAHDVVARGQENRRQETARHWRWALAIIAIAAGLIALAWHQVGTH
jgi:carbon monoxide dehydrogenase subunit G